MMKIYQKAYISFDDLKDRKENFKEKLFLLLRKLQF